MYDLGDDVDLTATIKNSSGVVADATTVSCVVTLPDLTTASTSVTRTSTGTYSISFTPTISGRHQVAWTATGANKCALTDVFNVRDTSELPPVSLQELKDHLNITVSTSDEELRDTLDAATAIAEMYCARSLSTRLIVETFNGRDGVLLTHPVALSVSSVVEDGVTLTTNDYQLVAGVAVDRLSGGSVTEWSRADSGNVVVTYLAGLSGAELNAARRGVLEIARHLWRTQRGSQNIGARDEWTPGEGFSIPNRAAQLLDPLRVIASA